VAAGDLGVLGGAFAVIARFTIEIARGADLRVGLLAVPGGLGAKPLRFAPAGLRPAAKH
jgi:hypothetical protein